MSRKGYVLIVDDDEGMCETLSDIITETGFRVTVAENGAKAVEEVDLQSFDFVLIDIMMPEQNGIETLRRIRSIDSYVTAIVMTGHDSMEGLISEALRAGADGILYKPFEIEAVLEILEWKEQHGSALPRIDLRKYEIQPQALRLISEEMARENGVMPLSIDHGVLRIAVADAEDFGVISRMRKATGLHIDALRAPEEDVLRAIELNYRRVSETPSETAEPVRESELARGQAAGPGVREGREEEGEQENDEVAATGVSARGAGSDGTGIVSKRYRESSAASGRRSGRDRPQLEWADLGGRQMEEGLTLTAKASRRMDAAERESSEKKALKSEEKTTVNGKDESRGGTTPTTLADSAGADGEGLAEQEAPDSSARVVKLGADGLEVRKMSIVETGSAELVEAETEGSAMPVEKWGRAGSVKVLELASEPPSAIRVPIREAGSAAAEEADPSDLSGAEQAGERVLAVKVKSFRLAEDEETGQEVPALAEDSSELAAGEPVAGQVPALTGMPDQPALLEMPGEAFGPQRVVLEQGGGTSVAHTLDQLLAQAVRDGSSDIHIEPQQDCLRVRYRINGVLHNGKSLPLSVHTPLVSRTKVLSNMNIAEQHRPQDGEMSVSLNGRKIDFRVATSNTAWGEMVVLRVLGETTPITDLTELGFSPDCMTAYSRLLKAPCGLILVCGPAGSGRTTTLYASIHQLDRDERKVITIEDPIECRFDGISQMEVNRHADISMTSGLRASMRLDSDVILVGDIREQETAKVAVQAALTGYLILSSIQANDAVDALFRLIDLGIEPFLVTSALSAVVAQRLVRRVCPHCQALREASDEERVAYERELGKKRTSFVYGEGCDYCAQTGYKGRTGIQEILVMTEVIRHMLIAGAEADDIRAKAMQHGMVSMRRDGMMKVKAGMITPYEVLRSVSDLG